MMDLPEDLWTDIKAMARARFEQAMAEVDSEITKMAMEYATKFIDVSDIGGDKSLMHVATGKVLKIKVELE